MANENTPSISLLRKNVELNLVFKLFKKINNTFRFKDILPKHINLKVFYRFKCDAYNSMYIDQTKQHLWTFKIRQCEPSISKCRFIILYRKDIKVLYTEKKNVTAIKKHCHQNEHRCSVDYFEIVDNAINDFEFKLKESLLAFKMKPCLKIRKNPLPLYLLHNDSSNVTGK